ncbi:MAG: hypothetical protein LBP94_01105 [Zoogloeaceae bacterium]|jgi:hypothetical protein|nr:hypothetical protein [Zoogloeaceae bacterium]
MNFSVSDFIRIRWGLLFLAAAISLAAIMTATARNRVHQAQAEQTQLTMQARDIRARSSRMLDEERELRGKIALFQQLRTRGIIGPEERLNWVEQIEKIKATRRLFEFQYEIAPQKSLGAVTGDYEFMVSAMSLNMPLLHEDDLLGFLADLQGAVHAHLLARDCSIERSAQAQEDAQEDRMAAQLQASCAIDWITVREKRQ